LRGIKMYQDNNMLENARAKHKAVAIVVSMENIP